jgi:hypothetical protein
MLARVPDEFLPNIVDGSLGIIGIYQLQERFVIQINLHQLIIFPAKHLLLSFLYYAASVDTSFKNILEGVDCILRWRLNRRSHGREGGLEGVVGDG